MSDTFFSINSNMHSCLPAVTTDGGQGSAKASTDGASLAGQDAAESQGKKPGGAPTKSPVGGGLAADRLSGSGTLLETKIDNAKLLLGTLSGRVGDRRVGVEGAVVRLTEEQRSGAWHASATFEALSVRVGAGRENADGSLGAGSGLLATIFGGEVTVGHSGSSVTFGAAAGYGLEMSGGVRDADGDGLKERCGRIVAGPVTLGLCVEED